MSKRLSAICLRAFCAFAVSASIGAGLPQHAPWLLLGISAALGVIWCWAGDDRT